MTNKRLWQRSSHSPAKWLQDQRFSRFLLPNGCPSDPRIEPSFEKCQEFNDWLADVFLEGFLKREIDHYPLIDYFNLLE